MEHLFVMDNLAEKCSPNMKPGGGFQFVPPPSLYLNTGFSADGWYAMNGMAWWWLPSWIFQIQTPAAHERSFWWGFSIPCFHNPSPTRVYNINSAQTMNWCRFVLYYRGRRFSTLNNFHYGDSDWLTGFPSIIAQCAKKSCDGAEYSQSQITTLTEAPINI